MHAWFAGFIRTRKFPAKMGAEFWTKQIVSDRTVNFPCFRSRVCQCKLRLQVSFVQVSVPAETGAEFWTKQVFNDRTNKFPYFRGRFCKRKLGLQVLFVQPSVPAGAKFWTNQGFNDRTVKFPCFQGRGCKFKLGLQVSFVPGSVPAENKLWNLRVLKAEFLVVSLVCRFQMYQEVSRRKLAPKSEQNRFPTIALGQNCNFAVFLRPYLRM